MKIYHIMPIENFYYNESIIKMINDNPKFFDKGEHYFITVNEQGYKKYKNTNNMVYDKEILGKKRVKILKEYIDKSDYTIIHSKYIHKRDLLKLNKKYLNKIIWGVWGHDLYTQKSGKQNILKSILKKLFSIIEKSKINQFKGVGIGFKYDAIEVRKKYDKIKIYPLLYGYKKDSLKKTNAIFNKKIKRKKNDPIKIMIGHSGYPFLNHIKILNDLYKFKDENILISMPLNYGQVDYINNVEEIAKKLYDNKVEFITENMEYEQYLEYIKSIDICILDFEHQAALGNLWLLLKNNTKLFLNENGIIKLTMMLEMIETYNVSEIKNMSFDEFSRPVKPNDNNIRFADEYLNEINAVNKFKVLIDELRKSKEK